MVSASKKRSLVFVFFSAIAGMMFGLAGLSVSVFSQQASFKRISIEEGLSQSAVHCLLQDKLGFIWLGTQDGLNRYDGYGFKIFRHDPQDSLSISDNWIQTIYEDRNGKLWIGTDGDGLNCYDRQTQSFVRYSARKGKPGSLPHGRVWAISEDVHGTLWVGTIGGGLATLNQTTHTFTIYDTSNTSLASNEIMSLRATQDGKLWVGTFGGGLYRMDPQTMQMQVYRHNPRNASSLADDRIRTIIEDQHGTLWIGTYNGLSILDRSDQEQGRFRSVQDSVLTSRAVFALTENTDETVWVGTFGSGIRTIDRTGRIVSSYKYDAKDATSLGDNSLYAFFCDRSGRMWIGTYSGGVNVFDTRKKDFRSMRHDPHNLASISDNRVRSIWKDTDGTMWLGTFKGLNRLDSRTGYISFFTSESGASSSLPENRIRIIRRDTKGRLWIGTSAAGLAVMDSLTNKIS
ncbi:MAG TPA: two-component regulator propeller domain-containing protein, partial [bacterium]|nr:two-component regulator propeller domain-containing protein [bacterium]